MKQDALEQFIDKEREAFDDAYPSLKLWANIEKELGAETPATVTLKPRRPWYQIAAAVLVLITVGGAGGLYLGSHQQQNNVEALLNKIAPEFAETEHYYNQKINQQYAKFTSHISDPDLDADLSQIDQAMADLREELMDAPEGREEQIVQELIDSYRLKLQILDRVLEHINQTNDITPNNNSNETSI